MANKQARAPKRGPGRPPKKRHQRKTNRVLIRFGDAQIKRIQQSVDLRFEVLREEVLELAPFLRDAAMRDVERQIVDLEMRRAQASEPALAGSPA